MLVVRDEPKGEGRSTRSFTEDRSSTLTSIT